MATYKDPVKCFAPIEMVERLLEIRGEFGFVQALYLPDSSGLADCLDANGFDIYAFSTTNEELNYGDYSAPVVPGGDNIHSSVKAH
jgi:hypothetical protein